MEPSVKSTILDLPSMVAVSQVTLNLNITVDIFCHPEYNENMKKTSNNVIQFPSRGRNQQAPISDVEIATNVNMVKFNHINETLNTIIPMLFNNMEIAGFSIIPEEEDDDENMKDGALVVEAVRSLLCKYYEIDHPFQKLSENLFEHVGDGSLSMVEKLDMELIKEIERNSES